MTAMRLIKVWLPSGSMVAIKAGPTPTPGLFVNEDPTIRGNWNLTHLASGCAVAVRLDSPEQALDLAVKLGPVCDWTVSAKALLAEMPAVNRRWRRVMEAAGAMEIQPGPEGAAPRDSIAAMEPLS